MEEAAEVPAEVPAAEAEAEMEEAADAETATKLAAAE